MTAGDPGARLFVGVSWAALLLATLWLVWEHGWRVPFIDEYAYLTPVLIEQEPFYTGVDAQVPAVIREKQTVSLGWLWRQYGDNRIPFAKVLNLALLRLTNYEFRVGAVFNVLALGLTSLGLILAAARVRGQVSPTDAVFPLVLLNWGQYENLVWSMQLHYVLAHVVLFTLLIFIVLQPRSCFPRSIWLAGGCVAVLPTLGPGALAYVPALVLWLVLLGIRAGQDCGPRSRQVVLVVWGLAVVALTLLAVYFWGYESGEVNKPAMDVTTWGRGILQALAMTLVTDRVATLVPVEGGLPLWAWLAVSLLVWYATTVVVLVLAWLERPAERLRVAGLLLFMVGTACLLVVLSKARAEGDQLLTQPRYALFTMPLLFTAYFAWSLYGPQPASRFLLVSLFVLLCVLLPLNFQHGLDITRFVSSRLETFTQDLSSGKLPCVLADEYFTHIYTGSGDPYVDELNKVHLAAQLRGLRQKGIPPFHTLPPEPETDRVRYPNPQPADSRNIIWEETTAHGDAASSLTYGWPKARRILAVQVEYQLEKPTKEPTTGQVWWRNSAVSDFDGTKRRTSLNLAPTGPPGKETPRQTAWIWVNDTLDQLRIHPDAGPFTLRITELTLVVPR